MGTPDINVNNDSPSWMEIVSKYNFSDPVRSWWQVTNSVGPYLILWAAMVWSLNIFYFLTLFLAVFAAGFLVRIFIIFHDCGHGITWRSDSAPDALCTIRARKITTVVTVHPNTHVY